MNEVTKKKKLTAAERAAKAEAKAAAAAEKAARNVERAAAKAAAQKRRDAINAAIGARLDRMKAEQPNITAQWNAERAEEERRLKKLKKRIDKRTRKDMTKHAMFPAPVKLPEVPQQPDLSEPEVEAPPPRDGLLPGTYRVVDPASLGAVGLLDPDPLPPVWTPRHVGARLIEAMDVLQSSPGRVGPKGYGAMWPAYRHESGELAHQAGAGTLAIGRNVIRRSVGADEAARANEALLWPMQFLNHVNAWALLSLNYWASDPEATPEDEDAPHDMLKFIADCLNAAKEPVR